VAEEITSGNVSPVLEHYRPDRRFSESHTP